MRRFRNIAASLLFLAAVTAPTFAQDGNCTQKDESTRPDCPGAIAFFERVHRALETDDHQSLAALIGFPLRARLNQKSTLIRTPKEFLAHFDEIFDAGVRCSVLGARDNEVWGNSNGFTVEAGAIWFDRVIPKRGNPDINAPDEWTRYPFRIVTVNNEADYSCTSK